MTTIELRGIVEIQLVNVQKMLTQREIKLNVTDEVKDWLVKIGYDVTYGARPLKRTIQKYLINPLSQELLAGNFEDGDKIKVLLNDTGHLDFRKEEIVD